MRHFGIAFAAMALIATAPAQTGIDDLEWMSGRWESVSGDRWVEEIWSAPRGGTLFGISRTGEGEALREFEFLRIHIGDDGRPFYLASPGGRPAIAFALTEAGESSATFENRVHDFPQRIHYARDGDTMRATVSAADGSNVMSWTFRRLP